MLNLTFSKKLRLLNYKEFSLVFQNKKKIYTSKITTFLKFNNLQHPRIGIFIPKKNIKFAHDRNRIKRIIRENFRINQYKISNIDFVFVLNNNIDNDDLKKDLHNIWFNK